MTQINIFNGLIRYTRYFRLFGTGASFVLAILLITLVFPIIDEHNMTDAAVNPSTTTLTMTTGYTGASLYLLANDINGTFASSSEDQSAKFGITTNNYTGYTLSLKGSNDTKQLSNIDADAALESIVTTTGIEESAFDTATFNGKWGYKPSKYNSTVNTNKFYEAPTTDNVATLDVTNTANTTTPNEYTIGLGARIDYTKPTGNYISTFVLTAVANAVGYTINYTDNSGDATVANLPSSQSGDTATTHIALNPSSQPTRTNYTFKGWCDGTVIGNGTICNGNILKTGDTIGIDQTTTNIITLYAVWEINNVTYTLNYDANGGSGAPAAQSNTNSTGSYTFTINTSNIPTWANHIFLGYSLDDRATTPVYTYNSSNNSFTPNTITLSKTSLASDTAFATLYAIWRSDYMQDASEESLASLMPELGNSTTLIDRRNSNSYQITKIGDLYWMTSNLRITGTISAADSNFTGNDVNISVRDLSNGDSYTEARTRTGTDGKGNSTVWYNLCAASAGTDCDQSESKTTIYDICPSGWRLPTNEEFLRLSNTYTSYATTYFAVYGGSWRKGSIYNQSTSTNYWSSTPDFESATKYAMYYNSSQAPGTYPDDRGYGFYVRCVFGELSLAPEGTAGPMQEASASSLAELLSSDGDTVEMYDERDYQIYNITKINGNYWMADNLRTANFIRMGESNYYYDDFNISAGDLSDGNSFTQARSHTSTDSSSNSTVWYNYCAASAGKICTDSDDIVSNADICPIGWRLPTSSELSSVTSYKNYFKPTTGGYYNDGSLSNTGYGYYWSADSNSVTNRDALMYNGSTLSITNLNRQSGAYIRCIKDISTYSGQTCMQDFKDNSKSKNLAIRDSMPEDEIITLTDNRDSINYYVVKLKDGNVWMLDDLQLDPTTVSESQLKGNTNATDQSISYLKNGGGTGRYANGAVSASWASSYTNPRVYTGYKNSTTSKAGSGLGKIGIYYNYCAVSAGSYCYAENSGVGDSIEDICPAGWMMPAGNNTTNKNTYYYLKSSYGGDISETQKALSVTYAGYLYHGDGGIHLQGSYFHYSTYTINDSSYMNAAFGYTDTFSILGKSLRNDGSTVRCIMK